MTEEVSLRSRVQEIHEWIQRGDGSLDNGNEDGSQQ